MYASLFHQFLEPGLDLLVQPQLLDRVTAATAGLRFPGRALGLGEQHGLIAHQIGEADLLGGQLEPRRRDLVLHFVQVEVEEVGWVELWCYRELELYWVAH